MSRYYVEGTFEGYIEADSADEAEGNFDESDIEDITILTVYKDEDEDGEQELTWMTQSVKQYFT